MQNQNIKGGGEGGSESCVECGGEDDYEGFDEDVDEGVVDIGSEGKCKLRLYIRMRQLFI